MLHSGSKLDKCGILPILDIVCNIGKSSRIAFTVFLEHKQLKLELKDSLTSSLSSIE